MSSDYVYGWYTVNYQPKGADMTYYIVESGDAYLADGGEWTYLIEDAKLFKSKRKANKAACATDEDCTIAIYSLNRAGEI